jgi:hypothetical protein
MLNKIMTHAEWWKVALMTGRLYMSHENYEPWYIGYENFLQNIGVELPAGQAEMTRGDAIRLLYLLKDDLRF